MSTHTQRVVFENYLFRIPPRLLFEKDGNTQTGEYLFFHDAREKYLFSFETGMQCFDLMLRGKKHLRSEEYSDDRMKISFCYPETQPESRGCMVYFHAELLDPSGCTHILPGQLNISSGNTWSAELKSILLELLTGVEVGEKRSAS